MNFWIFKYDDSRGYYDPIPSKKYNNSRGTLLYLLIRLTLQLFRLAGNILLAIGFLFALLIHGVKKLTRNF